VSAPSCSTAVLVTLWQKRLWLWLEALLERSATRRRSIFGHPKLAYDEGAFHKYEDCGIK
jgi:hypothetical protein